MTAQQHRWSSFDVDRSVRGAIVVGLDDVVLAFLNRFDAVHCYRDVDNREIVVEALTRDGVLRATEMSAGVLVVWNLRLHNYSTCRLCCALGDDLLATDPYDGLLVPSLQCRAPILLACCCVMEPKGASVLFVMVIFRWN